MANRSVIIVGAGIAGLSAALALVRTGWRVTVLERAPHLRGGAYVVGFSGLGYAAADRLGLLPALESCASPWRDAQHVDKTGRVRAVIPVAAQRGLVGSRIISILRGDLERCLHDALHSSGGGVDLRFSSTVVDSRVEPEGISATVNDGSVIEADLLIGADGQHSDIRRMVFGPESQFAHDFGAAVVSFTVTDPPAELVDRTTFFVDVDRGAGIYPQRDGDLAAFFTFTSNTRVDLEAGAAATLRRVYGNLDWIWPDLLARAADAESIFFDSISQVRMPIWHRDRVVLLGDAAWAVSLLAGQGSSLAVGGAALLADRLRDGSDIPSALSSWERRLRLRVLGLQWLGRRSRQLFIPTHPLAVKARELAVAATAHPQVSTILSRRP